MSSIQYQNESCKSVLINYRQATPPSSNTINQVHSIHLSTYCNDSTAFAKINFSAPRRGLEFHSQLPSPKYVKNMAVYPSINNKSA